MRDFIKDTLKTDQIDKINFDDLKKQIEGDGMLKRL